MSEQSSGGENLKRAAWANKTLRDFAAYTGCDQEDSLGDLLDNLMHLADARGLDFEQALERARQRYAAEIAAERVEEQEGGQP